MRERARAAHREDLREVPVSELRVEDRQAVDEERLQRGAEAGRRRSDAADRAASRRVHAMIVIAMREAALRDDRAY